ncbi:hypothetical protein [Nostoc sp.]|uniref:hypothetical protein n=1 Tax=Nostoc sp. TaxID=1180 RepID=UPI002FF3E58F
MTITQNQKFPYTYQIVPNCPEKTLKKIFAYKPKHGFDVFMPQFFAFPISRYCLIGSSFDFETLQMYGFFQKSDMSPKLYSPSPNS